MEELKVERGAGGVGEMGRGAVYIAPPSVGISGAMQPEKCSILNVNHNPISCTTL